MTVMYIKVAKVNQKWIDLLVSGDREADKKTFVTKDHETYYFSKRGGSILKVFTFGEGWACNKIDSLPDGCEFSEDNQIPRMERDLVVLPIGSKDVLVAVSDYKLTKVSMIEERGLLYYVTGRERPDEELIDVTEDPDEMIQAEREQGKFKTRVVWGITADDFFSDIAFGKVKKKEVKRILLINKIDKSGGTSYHRGISIQKESFELSDEYNADAMALITVQMANDILGIEKRSNKLLGSSISFQGYLPIGDKLVFTKGMVEVVKDLREHSFEDRNYGFVLLGQHFSSKPVVFKKRELPFLSLKYDRGEYEAAISLETMEALFIGVGSIIIAELNRIRTMASLRDGFGMVTRFRRDERVLFEKLQELGVDEDKLQVLAYARAINFAKLELTETKSIKIRPRGSLRLYVKPLIHPSQKRMIGDHTLKHFNEYCAKVREFVNIDGRMVPIIPVIISRSKKLAYFTMKDLNEHVADALGSLDFDDNGEFIKTKIKLRDGDSMYTCMRFPATHNGAVCLKVFNDSNFEFEAYDIKPRYYGDFNFGKGDDVCFIDAQRGLGLNNQFSKKLEFDHPATKEDFYQSMVDATLKDEIEMGPWYLVNNAARMILLAYEIGILSKADMEKVDLHRTRLVRCAGIDPSDKLDREKKGEGNLRNHLLGEDIDPKIVTTDYRFIKKLFTKGVLPVPMLSKAMRKKSFFAFCPRTFKDTAIDDYRTCVEIIEDLSNVLDQKKEELIQPVASAKGYTVKPGMGPIGKTTMGLLNSSFMAKKECETELNSDGEIPSDRVDALHDQVATLHQICENGLERVLSGLKPLTDDDGDNLYGVHRRDVWAAYGLSMFNAYLCRYNTRIGQDGLFFITCLGLLQEQVGINMKLKGVSSVAFEDRYIWQEHDAARLEGMADDNYNDMSYSEFEMDSCNGSLHSDKMRKKIPHLAIYQQVLHLVCFPSDRKLMITGKGSRKKFDLEPIELTEDRVDILDNFKRNSKFAKKRGFDDFLEILHELVDENDISVKTKTGGYED